MEGISSDAAMRRARIQQELIDIEAPLAPKELLDQIPSMHPETRATVCIPVAAFDDQEVETLPRTLEQLGGQTASIKSFEIVLFLNRPEGESRDDTTEIVKYAERHMPNLYCIDSEIPKDKVLIGYIRALLHGVVSERARRAGLTNLIHIITDADMVWLHPNLIHAHLDRLATTHADACIGQLDWDHLELPTRELPILIVGAAMMRLMPKYANKRLIELASRGVDVDPSHLHEVVFARNFGRGVLANAAIRDQTYRHIGGYQPLAHGEDYDIMQRIWEAGRRLGRYNTLCFGWEEHDIVVASNSRRALWAMHVEGLPMVRQWDYAGYNGTAQCKVRNFVPKMDVYRCEPTVELLTQQINKSLIAFPLPATLLQEAVPMVLEEMGLSMGAYTMQILPVIGEPILSVTEITIINPFGLFSWLRQEQTRLKLDRNI
ncbi:MAG: hypothetical protein G01um101466_39 [Parcubacteria group bacterium Gr01-1014_66]|nr:MAG: hypothetical protein G01um101466_39 [Parcubacteria group bacterium Gr01-1014_66]